MPRLIKYKPYIGDYAQVIEHHLVNTSEMRTALLLGFWCVSPNADGLPGNVSSSSRKKK